MLYISVWQLPVYVDIDVSVCVFLNAVREPRTNFRNKWQKIIKVADIKNKDIWSFTDFASFHLKYIHIIK